jgi:apolipoprotein N-acyltransferase
MPSPLPSKPPSPLLRILLGTGLSLLSAGMLLLSQPPYGIWPLAFLGFVPVLVAQHRILPPRLSSLAQAIAIGLFLGTLIPQIFGEFAAGIWFFRWLFLIVGTIVFFTELGTRAMNQATGYRWFVLQGALVWVGIEMIRNLIPSIGTGGFIGYAYYRSPWLIQPVSLFGIFGINLLTLLLGYALGLGALAWFDRISPRRGWPGPGTIPVPSRLAFRWLAAAGLLAAAWTGLSLAQWWSYRPAETVRAAAVHPNAPYAFQVLKQLSVTAASEGAQLVIWPEGSINFDPQGERRAEIQALARETGAYLVIGYSAAGDMLTRNEAAVVSPAGEFLGVYGKEHPVVFVGERATPTRGQHPVFETTLGPIGTIICHDLNYNDTIRKVARNGARFIAVPSNDWPALTYRQQAYLVYRAVETRTSAMKADTRYDSFAVSARGEILAGVFNPEGRRGYLLAEVPLGSADAPQLLLGDWVGWISLAGLAFFVLPNPLLKPRPILKRTLGEI